MFSSNDAGGQADSITSKARCARVLPGDPALRVRVAFNNAEATFMEIYIDHDSGPRGPGQAWNRRMKRTERAR